MDRQKQRKSHENRRFPCDGGDFSNSGKVTFDGKSKNKRHNDKKSDISSNFFMNWAPQARIQPFSQRQYTSESSVCHYSVPLSLSFEPVSLPIYPALIQPQGSCTLPLEIGSHSNRFKQHKKYKNKQDLSRTNSIIQNEPPAIFYTSKVKSGDQQDYTSLPPVNCDFFTAKTSDTEAVCKRRFSDPGIGQMSSSDDCSSIRSDDSNISSETAEIQSRNFNTLAEQINELRKCNSFLKKELSETKMELETFKMQSLTWQIGSEDFKPGSLSDAVSEIRNAVKLSEEALISKVVQMLEKNSIECKETQEKLEEKLKAETNERLTRLEEQIHKSLQQQVVFDTPSVETFELQSKDKDSDVQQQIVELEREKFQLRKELQEAIAKRKTAEAATEKLERLVGILRKKINGVSLESCIPDEKHILVRPLASSLEKNPFIIANNKQGQKPDIPSFSKPKISPFRGFSLDNSEGTNVVLVENKENENGEVNTGNGSGSGNQMSLETSTTAQVTITGPVTDL